MIAALRLLPPVAVAVAAVAGGVQAATVTGSLAVRVVVQPACTVSGATMDFGTYTTGQSGDLLGSAVINYTDCLGTLRFDLSGGTNGTTTARRAANGTGAFVNYALFKDTNRTQNFGDGTSGHTVSQTTIGSGNVTVYGRVAGRQAVPAGTYTDLVTITLTF